MYFGRYSCLLLALFWLSSGVCVASGSKEKGPSAATRSVESSSQTPSMIKSLSGVTDSNHIKSLQEENHLLRTQNEELFSLLSEADELMSSLQSDRDDWMRQTLLLREEVSRQQSVIRKYEVGVGVSGAVIAALVITYFIVKGIV